MTYRQSLAGIIVAIKSTSVRQSFAKILQLPLEDVEFLLNRISTHGELNIGDTTPANDAAHCLHRLIRMGDMPEFIELWADDQDEFREELSKVFSLTLSIESETDAPFAYYRDMCKRFKYIHDMK